jgi:hypothetical protein
LNNIYKLEDFYKLSCEKSLEFEWEHYNRDAVDSFEVTDSFLVINLVIQIFYGFWKNKIS